MGRDITKNNLSIKNISLVFKNTIPYTARKVKIPGRHSDAFVYVISGSCDYEFESGEKFRAEAKDVFYLPYKSVYSMQLLNEDYRFIYCDFDFYEADGKPDIFKMTSIETIDALFIKLYNLYRSNPEKSYAECMSVLYSIYASLRNSRDGSSHGEGIEAIIKRAKEKIDECFDDQTLSVGGLCPDGEISEVYFRKLFKEKYGVSPIKYLTSVRLKNAKKLMEYPFLTLEECSRRSGFSTVQYFGRVFLKEFGISPGQYRKGL